MKKEKKNNKKEEVIVEKKSKKVLSFFMTTLNGMAYGLFATLIVGTIVKTLAENILFGNAKVIVDIKNILVNCSNFVMLLTGAGIGVGIALVLKFDALKTIVLASSIFVSSKTGCCFFTISLVSILCNSTFFCSP